MNEPLTQVTALIALIVTLITYGQWITNRARLKLELFEKRYAVYEKIAAFLAETLMKGRLIKGNEDKFSRDTKNAYFVYGCDKSVKNLVSQIYSLACDLDAHSTEETGLVGEAKINAIREQRKAKNAMQEIFDDLEQTFEKYLKLAH